MEAIIELDASRWGVQVATLQRRLGLEQRELLTDQSRLFLQQVISLTPPKTLQQGRARTGQDIAKVVKPFNTTAFKNKRLEEIVNQRDYRSFERFMQFVNNSALKGATAGPFSAAADTHRQLRNHRGGVGGRDRKHFVIGRSEVAALKKYTKRKLSHVGLAKSGWLLALWTVGGSAPSWIEKQLQRGQGGVHNALHEADPYIVAENKTPWAENRDEGLRIVRTALTYRVKAMETFLKRALERAAVSAGIDVKAS